MMIQIPSMADIWMQTALGLSERSQCSKAKVGCLIVTSDMRHVLGNGYNGGPSKVDYVCTKETCSCLHAETNAAIDAGSHDKDKVFFVTMFPCKKCAIQIINSGASQIYFHYDYKPDSKHWLDHESIKQMLFEAEINVFKI